ncbi:glutamate synthase large subunit [Chlorobium phaeobacteroides]|uniref:Glutamate synthase [NADPH] large chain n=1 Tax=Chlorobium phaeobacteroides (strain DSM 266 / SMG 266 / 2430) TaxID=290317 RepID=A1BE56_CHLPD|nr:glutamate synthase large subunit [Chlorobium phaeobacteroides]ABL64683.1 glutamate synthase (NADH) large subunit [Chlorobium phaeobacteroides DSM 266]
MNDKHNVGLYDPQFEHDACGVGFVAHIKGIKSHDIVEQGLRINENLKHRGACGCEKNTGDGAGILLQVPDKFLRRVCAERNIDLPPEKQYGVGMVFLPPDISQRRAIEDICRQMIQAEGQKFLGFRKVTTNNATLGQTAKSQEPVVKQLFVGRSKDVESELDFERKLYVIRRRITKRVKYTAGLLGSSYFYISSLSYRTIVYKGMLLPEQVGEFYPELHDQDMESAIAMVHSRFSTNTFPSWDRAHPYRFLSHNGEINTLKGNVNWMKAREKNVSSRVFGDAIEDIKPVILEDGSDSAILDNTFEFLALSGRSLAHAAMMIIPEPWSGNKAMDQKKRSFYEYHSCLMEPWDGPASVTFTDGIQIGAVLDRNGLRPSRYYITSDDLVIMASEVGVLDIAPERILKKDRLQPGRMFLVDTAEGRIISDEEIKQTIASEQPYAEWIERNMIDLETLPDHPLMKNLDEDKYSLTARQKIFGYTQEDISMQIIPMSVKGVELVGSMGNDTPLAVLSNRPKLLYDYFKQLFAQVTNPPIDSLREEIITSTTVMLGTEGNLLDSEEVNCRRLRLPYPLLSNPDLEKIRGIEKPGFRAVTFPIFYDVANGGKGIESAMQDLYRQSEQAVHSGVNIIILSDKGEMEKKRAPIPSLLAVSGMHNFLINAGLRTRVGLVLESAEPRTVHHFAMLISYGAGAVNPYMAFETIRSLIASGHLKLDEKTAVKNYIKAGVKGVVKTMAKMGISTIQSYRGAQIFEAVGLNSQLVDAYFTKTPTRIEGIGLDTVAEEVHKRHQTVFPPSGNKGDRGLDAGGERKWRYNGEFHLFGPEAIHFLQHSCRTDDYRLFKKYENLIDDQSEHLCTIRGLMDIRFSEHPVPLEEVESVEEILKRFKTGAMSYGSISKEAHETLAIAMNRIGGKSNTGEGGEDPARYVRDANGDSRMSSIKQVASGRFGVTSEYLASASEIQIKMAQGAKPGEGGQLPGSKVYPWVAKVRHSTPGVGLISPPPHHDIYSIEDLAQLIHDLKNANREARINVKLVSTVGVGTIAAGVAKAHADVVLISGHDGGTGASPISSIMHAGMPWELGLAEAHQTLVLNNLRSRIIVEADGQLKTARDIVIAAMLGAEEFGFATTTLVVMGCIMMRACQDDSCPVGVATQNPELRRNFKGKPEHVVTFMRFLAEGVREYMARLGVRKLNDLVGRSELLGMKKTVDHWKAQGVDLSKILYHAETGEHESRYCTVPQEHGLDDSLDLTTLLTICEPAIKRREKVFSSLPIKNINRVVGTIIGYEVTKAHGSAGLPDDTIHLKFTGSAGQSFGAFIPKGMKLELEGDANDYVGKGLSGGKIIVYPPKNSVFVPEENIIIGNVGFYGATSGEAFISGMAGERFCVRNSGLKAVVEAIGDHGCEYMTGGLVIILGKTGRNFAAGMSGGIAYVYDADGTFPEFCNRDMVSLSSVQDAEELSSVHAMIEKHVEYTGSALGKSILAAWQTTGNKIVKVMPDDYKRALDAMKEVRAAGLTGDEADMAAFEKNVHDPARVSGN